MRLSTGPPWVHARFRAAAGSGLGSGKVRHKSAAPGVVNGEIARTVLRKR